MTTAAMKLDRRQIVAASQQRIAAAYKMKIE
jgi:hypothetical protein